jgi:hypothetical protein
MSKLPKSWTLLADRHHLAERIPQACPLVSIQRSTADTKRSINPAGLSSGSFGFSLKDGTDRQKPNDLPGKPVGFKEGRIASVLVSEKPNYPLSESAGFGSPAGGAFRSCVDTNGQACGIHGKHTCILGAISEKCQKLCQSTTLNSIMTCKAPYRLFRARAASEP